MTEVYDPIWFLEVIEEAKQNDLSLQGRFKLVSSIEHQIKLLKPVNVEANRDGNPRNTNYYFVDPHSSNQPGSKWQFQTDIKFDGNRASLIVSVVQNDRLGSIEVWRVST